MKALLITVVIILAGAALWLYQGKGGNEAPAGMSAPSPQGRKVVPELVTVEAVGYREIIDSIESIGTTHANESVTIISKVTDTVNAVHFEDGDYVEAGKILVQMTNREESALLAEAQANLEDARRQLTRQQDLGKRGLAAKSTVDETIARAEAAEARFNAITARMNDRLIRAPFSGLLGFRQISPGTLLTSNTPITTIDDISVIKLDFSVPEIYMGIIRPGFRIIARSEAWKDRDFEGEVSNIGSRIDPITRAVTVRALINNDDRLLRPGMLLTVNVITAVRQALVIPESAFIQVGDETYVYIAGEDGLARRRAITVGSRKIGYVEVTDGLLPGDMIISEGGFKLRDNAPFRVLGAPGQSMQLSGQKPRAAGSS